MARGAGLTATVTATAVDAGGRGGRPWNPTAIRTLAPYTSLDAGGTPLKPIRNQRVGGSSPPVGSNDSRHLRARPGAPGGRLTAT